MSSTANSHYFWIGMFGQSGLDLDRSGQVLARLLHEAGYVASSFKIVDNGVIEGVGVSGGKMVVEAGVSPATLLLLLDDEAVAVANDYIGPTTIIVKDELVSLDKVKVDHGGVVSLPLTYLARQSGLHPASVGSVILGLLARHMGINSDAVKSSMDRYYHNQELQPQLLAANAGLLLELPMVDESLFSLVKPRRSSLGQVFLSGNQAAAAALVTESIQFGFSSLAAHGLAQVWRDWGVEWQMVEDGATAVAMAAGWSGAMQVGIAELDMAELGQTLPSLWSAVSTDHPIVLLIHSYGMEVDQEERSLKILAGCIGTDAVLQAGTTADCFTLTRQAVGLALATDRVIAVVLSDQAAANQASLMLDYGKTPEQILHHLDGDRLTQIGSLFMTESKVETELLLVAGMDRAKEVAELTRWISNQHIKTGWVLVHNMVVDVRLRAVLQHSQRVVALGNIAARILPAELITLAYVETGPMVSRMGQELLERLHYVEQ